MMPHDIRIRLVDTRVTPIWNTMAVIPGYIRDEVVILGCHRDGMHYMIPLHFVI